MSAGPQRVAIVRVDGIGDALMLVPLVAALRDAGHELGAVLSTRNRDAFAPGTFARVHALERIRVAAARIDARVVRAGAGRGPRRAATTSR